MEFYPKWNNRPIFISAHQIETFPLETLWTKLWLEKFVFVSLLLFSSSLKPLRLAKLYWSLITPLKSSNLENQGYMRWIAVSFRDRGDRTKSETVSGSLEIVGRDWYIHSLIVDRCNTFFKLWSFSCSQNWYADFFVRKWYSKWLIPLSIFL